MYGLRSEDDALDAVQDAMMKLSTHYGDRPAEEFPMLFQRILQNAIHDLQRRRKVRSFWVTLFSALGGAGRDADDDSDPLEHLFVASPSLTREGPAVQFERSELMAMIEREISRLPGRQREAFLMRYWEEMDITETAAAMGCSEGSVKTHCSRASQALAAALRAKGISL